MNRLGLRSGLLLAASSMALAQAAGASERIVYGYDALGRLVRVERSGPHGGVNAGYGYDCADNRRQVTVGPGAAPPPPPPPCPAPPPPSP